jgi:hypothetical protein
MPEMTSAPELANLENPLTMHEQIGQREDVAACAAEAPRGWGTAVPESAQEHAQVSAWP